VVPALGTPCGLTCLLHGGQQQSHEDRDNRDHDKQFNQRKRAAGMQGHPV
jgi:hypothetical protein